MMCPGTGEWWAEALPAELQNWKIAPLEMLAAWITTRMVVKHREGSPPCPLHHVTHAGWRVHVILFVDNSNVVNNLIKQRCRSQAIDHVWQPFQRELAKNQTYLQAHWISTHVNFVADTPRESCLDLTCVGETP